MKKIALVVWLVAGSANAFGQADSKKPVVVRPGQSTTLKPGESAEVSAESLVTSYDVFLADDPEKPEEA